MRENIENKCLENSQKVLSWVAAAENVCFEQHMVDVCWKEILGSDHLSKPRQLLHRLWVIMSAKIDWSLSLCDQNFFRERISVVRSFVSWLISMIHHPTILQLPDMRCYGTHLQTMQVKRVPVRKFRHICNWVMSFLASWQDSVPCIKICSDKKRKSKSAQISLTEN